MQSTADPLATAPVATGQLFITHTILRAALAAWEQDHRDGKTRSHAETDALPFDQVVDENLEHLTRRLTDAGGSTLPLLGTPWPGQGGRFAGLVLGEVDGKPVNQVLILCDALPAKRLNWEDAVAWAKSLEHEGHADYQLPTRLDLRLLDGNLRHLFEPDWYWSGEQYSRDSAWAQYFDGGTQLNDVKSYEGLARAVRRFSVQSLNSSKAAA